jgi:hypothetical protein
MHRMANKDYRSKVLLDFFFRPNGRNSCTIFFLSSKCLPDIFWGILPTHPPIKNQMVRPLSQKVATSTVCFMLEACHQVAGKFQTFSEPGAAAKNVLQESNINRNPVTLYQLFSLICS